MEEGGGGMLVGAAPIGEEDGPVRRKYVTKGSLL